MDLLPLRDDDAPSGSRPDPWQVLVVDDDPEMHTVTRLCFTDFEHEGRGLQVLAAHSGAEAREVLKHHHDIALVLLDVVMESEHAGLELARYIREELRNRTVRIVLRTGQPGQAPPREVVRLYEIDDYRTKTELTFERLHVLTVTALRTYQLLRVQEERERRLAQYSDEVERFAYAASHDLQTPLRTIVRFAQRLQEKYGALLSGEGQEYLCYVVQGSRDLHRLIEDLLEYTKIGRSDVPMVPVSLTDAVQQACSQLQTEIDIRRAVVDCGALPTVQGHREQLEEMFRQLIDNAIKFQPGAAPVVSIAAAAVGDSWEIRVSDRGIGIEPQHLARIFEPYRRLHRADEYPGSGIGLAICRKVAQLHGGTVRAQSVAGTGTTIIVTLPGAARVAKPRAV
jgi:two-component system, sensor histidine kinase